MPTHYEILGVPTTATQEEIKKAYRAMARKKHPDQGGDIKEFQELSKSYMILSDPEKRERYDRTGSDEPDLFEQMFQTLIMAAFERSDHPIQHLQDKLKRDCEMLETERTKAKIEHERYIKRMEKFNKKNPDNDLIPVLEHKSDMLLADVNKYTEALDSVKKMQDRLKQYKEDKAKPMMGSFVFSDARSVTSNEEMINLLKEALKR